MLPSSLIDALPDYDWSTWEPSDTDRARGLLAPLRAVFDQVPDPRRLEGRRHCLSAFLLLEALFQLAGVSGRPAYRWARRLPVSIRIALGFRAGRLPARSTIGEVIAAVDAAEVEAMVSGHLQHIAAVMRQHLADQARPGKPPLVHAAVDGKAMRGARKKGSKLTLMLVAVLEVATGIVLSQARVAPGKGKGGEIAAALVALDLVELIAGMVFTLDALHCQNATVAYFIERGAHYLIALKGNRRTLFAQVKALPWGQITDPDVATEEINRGRVETRSIKVIEAPDDFELDGAARIIEMTRTRKKKGRPGPGKKRVFYYVTSLNHLQASGHELHELIRNHWTVEVHHYIRDVVMGEDAHKARTGNIPWITAIMRNLALTLLRLAGHTRYREALEDNHADPWIALDLVI